MCLCVYSWLHCAWVAVRGLSLIARGGACSVERALASQHRGLWLQIMGSRCSGLVAQQHVGSSQTRDGTVSLALAGRF